jgi:hypothetical protein
MLLARKNLQVVDLLGGFDISWDVLGRHEICKWWSRRESNPRPQAITGQFYMRSWLISFSLLESRSSTLLSEPVTESRPEPSDPVQHQPM